MDRSNESLFLLRCARTQVGENDCRLISQLCAKGLDWEWIGRVAVQNRMAPLIYHSLRETGLHTLLPAQTMKELENSYYLGLSHSTLFKQAVREILLRFGEDIEAILLRGLVLGETIYGDPALRPFSDMDLLIRKQDLARAREALLDLGYRSSHGIDEKYFERNHLHLQYVRSKQGVVVELHWALDHKYTVFNINYAEIFAEAVRGQVAGVEALLMPPENLLLSLCIHLIKHCYYNKYILHRPDLAEVILASGFLILYCDIAEVIRRYGPDLDWDLVVRKTRRWQVESAVQPTLASVVQLFSAPVPQAILESLPAPKTGWLEGKLLALAVEDLKGERAEKPPSHPLRKLLDLRSDLMFRPVRMLDLLRYLWPAPRFVARRYNVSNPVLVPLYYGLHVCKALSEVFLNLIDLVYYTRLKQRRS